MQGRMIRDRERAAEDGRSASAILEDEETNMVITEQELSEAIKKLKWGRAAGHDDKDVS